MANKRKRKSKRGGCVTGGRGRGEDMAGPSGSVPEEYEKKHEARNGGDDIGKR